MVIVSRKFNTMPVGSLVKSRHNGVVYEVASKPHTAPDGRTVMDIVSYEDNRLNEGFPEMFRPLATY